MISTLDESGWKKDWSRTLKFISVENLSIGQWFLSEEKSVYRRTKEYNIFYDPFKAYIKEETYSTNPEEDWIFL